jgi:hypothetical protein
MRAAILILATCALSAPLGTTPKLSSGTPTRLNDRSNSTGTTHTDPGPDSFGDNDYAELHEVVGGGTSSGSIWGAVGSAGSAGSPGEGTSARGGGGGGSGGGGGGSGGGSGAAGAGAAGAGIGGTGVGAGAGAVGGAGPLWKNGAARDGVSASAVVAAVMAAVIAV